MTEALLTLLRWCLLGLLYLFFFRVLQATWAGSRATALVAAPPRTARGSKKRRAERAPSGPPKLVVLEPPSEAGREYMVNGELTIGRAASCHVTLDDTYISQLHARVSTSEQGIVVEDLGSTNGTYLNRQRVTSPVVASSGDRLQLGGIVMELR
ncbi:MAG: FHA domain-containing protein [Acidimicrobiia bacterium]|nr:FHA domain-containing protein [Acidimicrobiia bacterium]